MAEISNKKTRYNVIFITAIVFIALFTVIASIFIYKGKSDRKWVEHRRLIQAQLDDVISAGVEMESNVRGYMLTNNRELSNTYLAAKTRLRTSLDSTHKLLLKVEDQEKRLDTLKMLLDERINLLTKVRTDYAETGEVNEWTKKTIESGDRLMDRIRNLVTEMLDNENVLFDERTRSVKAIDSGALYLVMGFGLLTLLVTIYGFNQVQKENRSRKIADEKLVMTLENLKRSNEDLEQFAYVASHDLQEPLRKIRAFGDRFLLKFGDQHDQGRDYAERMVRAAKRMQGLIQDLLSFSRVSRDTGDKKRVNLNDTMGEVVDDLQVLISETKAEIKVGDMPTLPYANPSQMRQLFQNLVNNAIKFRKEDVPPKVKIKCRTALSQDLNYPEMPLISTLEYHEITIKDNGIGFDDKYLDKIFTIFQRLHGRSEYAGTGIGLAVCRKICANHNGFITARGSDSGATFIVLLPK